MGYGLTEEQRKNKAYRFLKGIQPHLNRIGGSFNYANYRLDGVLKGCQTACYFNFIIASNGETFGFLVVEVNGKRIENARGGTYPLKVLDAVETWLREKGAAN